MLGPSLPILVPAAITVAGWLVVGQQAERREFRSEIRSRISDLKMTGLELQQAAFHYWIECPARSDGPAAVALKASIMRLSRCVSILSEAGLKFDNSRLVTAIRQAATGGNFESANRRRSRADLLRVADIAATIEDLISAVEVAFYDRFKAPKSVPWVLGLFALFACIIALVADSSS